jgi:hypothetical protein
MLERGLTWYELQELYANKLKTALTITFAFVATHNHFVLDRGGKVFKQSAPIIKLPESATEDDHYALLAYLNSSTACFWMKQVCHNKTNASQKHTTDPARAAFEFAGTALADLPIFTSNPRVAHFARELCDVGQERARWLDGGLFLQAIQAATNTAKIEEVLGTGWTKYDNQTARGVFLQEEIDWAFYAAAGLIDEYALPTDDQPQHATLGTRPFELEEGYDSGVSVRVKRGVESTREKRATHPAWRTRIPLLARPSIKQLESREYKRMWRDTERNVDQADFRAELPKTWLTRWLLDSLETFFQSGKVVSLGSLLRITERPPVAAAIEYLGGSPAATIGDFLSDDSVPFLDGYTYTDTGLEKRRAWVETWEAQRAEDRGEPADPQVPPDYSQGSRGKSTDFRSSTYWSLRGKLDVPKERFISYPGAESDEDGEPVYGWAGWNHRQRAVALATLYTQRKSEGWAKDRLQPLLAGLLELLPWLEQWHGEPDADFDGAVPAVQFREFLDAECADHGFTYDDLRSWRPAEKKARKSAKRKARKESETSE